MVQFLIYDINADDVKEEIAKVMRRTGSGNLSPLMGEGLERSLIKDFKLGSYRNATNTTSSGMADIKTSAMMRNMDLNAFYVSSFSRVKGTSGFSEPMLPEIVDGLEVKNKALKLDTNKDGSFSRGNMSFKIGGTTLSESSLKDSEKGTRTKQVVDSIRKGDATFKNRGIKHIAEQLKKDPEKLKLAKKNIISKMKQNNSFLRKVNLFTLPLTIQTTDGKRREFGVVIANVGENKLTSEDLSVRINTKTNQVDIGVHGSSMGKILKRLQAHMSRSILDSRNVEIATSSAIKRHPKGEKGFISDLLNGVNTKILSITIGTHTKDELEEIIGNLNIIDDTDEFFEDDEEEDDA